MENPGRYVVAGLWMLWMLASSPVFAIGCPALNDTDLHPDPSSNFLPGKYFEYKAQFYLKNANPATALRMYTLAGYWGNKIAQYNVGMIYAQGAPGVPVDRERAAAWLGIAAESHHAFADQALQKVYATLSRAERDNADRIWQALEPEYGDAVTRRRAINRFESERRNVTGSRVGFVGDVTVCLPDGSAVTGSRYYAEMDKQFASYIDTMFGHVEVGPLAPAPASSAPTSNGEAPAGHSH